MCLMACYRAQNYSLITVNMGKNSSFNGKICAIRRVNSYMKEKIKRFLFFLSWYIPHESMNKRIICLVLSLQSGFYRPL